MTKQFPEIKIEGGPVQAKQFIEPGTAFTVGAATLIAILATVIGVISTMGVILIIALFYPLYISHLRKRALATIHGSGVLVDEQQFPQIYQCMTTFKERLGINADVSVYIVESEVANAAAVRYGKQNVILLTDDLIHGCLESGHPQALAFVIGHELGHIALNHTGVFRSWISQHLKKLGRLDEHSADSVATALVENKSVAYTGLLLLTVGYAMIPYVNAESLAQQAQEVAHNKHSTKAEKTLTHPLLLNRMYRIVCQ